MQRPEPASTELELDALIEHLVDAERRLTVAFAKAGVDSSVLNDMRLLSQAAAALVQLREENSARSDLMQGYLDCWRNDKYRAERADALQAENRLLRECARTPDLERIDAAIDAAREKP